MGDGFRFGEMPRVGWSETRLEDSLILTKQPKIFFLSALFHLKYLSIDVSSRCGNCAECQHQSSLLSPRSYIHTQEMN